MLPLLDLFRNRQVEFDVNLSDIKILIYNLHLDRSFNFKSKLLTKS